MSTVPADSSEGTPEINDNPMLQRLYNSLESRIGYRLLGNTRHFGYWEKDTCRIFPLNGPLRKMEGKLFSILNLSAGSKVLDAGCGDGHVALYMARHGLQVTCIDVIDRHLAKANENITAAPEISSLITIDKMDYHNLTLAPGTFDGVYTMETLVHATQPLRVLQGFHRVLRPGGRIAMHEYDHNYESDEIVGKKLAKLMREVSEYGAMPTWQRAKHGYYRQLLEEAGFVDIEERDYSENVRPMLRLFWMLAALPCYVIMLLRLDRYFINTIGGAHGYNAQKYWRYVAISARKRDIVEDDAQKKVN